MTTSILTKEILNKHEAWSIIPPRINKQTYPAVFTVDDNNITNHDDIHSLNNYFYVDNYITNKIIIW